MGKLFTNKWIQFALLFGLLFASVVLNFSEGYWRQRIKNFTFDTYNLLKPYETGNDVVIVDIDEASLSHDELGQWPWARTKLARLINQLDEMGAAVIAFDMVFAEPDRSSPKHILDIIDENDARVQDLRKTLQELPDNDEVFAKAIEDAGNIVTGFSFTDTIIVKAPRAIPLIITCQRGDECKDDPAEEYVRNLEGAATNLNILATKAAGNGSFFVSTDTDGIIRKVPMLVGHQKHDGQIVKIYPSLSLETFRVYKNLKEIRLVKDEAMRKYGFLLTQGVKFEKGPVIPTTTNGEFLVYYAYPDLKNWYVSAKDVWEGTVDPKRIKHKIVLIGTSAVGLKDIRSTPLSPFRPGVEVHLNILDQIIQGKFLYRTIDTLGLEVIFIVVAGLLIIAVGPFVGAIWQSLIVSLAIAVAAGAGWYAFTSYGWLIDVLYICLSITITFIVSSLLTYIRTETERKQIRGAFGHYVSPDLMEELEHNPDRLQLGGETRELTVMFTDIRSFTTISESLTPEELIQLMNDFLTPMSDLVMHNRGTIDKYMGDAMMAFWNAPLDDAEHARHACLTALKMNEALKPINEALAAKAKEQGKAPLVLSAGIGVNTGPASVGNMGSKQRFAYSALGDTVNLASRLEGQTKTYGVTNLIGEETYRHVPDLAALEIDLIRVKGKVKPVRVFTLLGDEKWTKNKAYQDWAACHAAMLEKYRSGDFAAALQLIAQCRQLARGNLRGVYDLYEKRIGEFHANPPGPDWDGVYVATSK